VLKFGAGIAPADVTYVEVGDDLVFKLANSTDQITVKDWLNKANNQIGQVKFADGTTWTNMAIRVQLHGILGVDPDMLKPVIDFAVNAMFNDAQNWRPRRDPLVLDLDGNGISTSGINPQAPILFDQDGDGTLTATGWIGAGDGLVVRDLNGNGTIDSGRELFGDSTVFTQGAHAGQIATNGFEALADLDSNADGRFDASDAAFGSVQLWKDANQDGISQSNELSTFAQLGVASINVTGTPNNVNLGGGNTQTFSGNFTRVGGAVGSAGTAELASSLLLANNNFYRTFTDNPALTSAAQALPHLQGSGLVRDLRPAMSLGTPQALDLQAKLTEFAGTNTRAGQQALVDDLLLKWADTSAGMVHSLYKYNMTLKDGRLVSTDLTNSDVGSYVLTLHPQGMEEVVSGGETVPTAEGYKVLSKLNVLEAFNGSKFLQLMPTTLATTGATQISATLAGPQIDFINQAYDALKETLYGGLVVQTRLKPYLDSIQISLGGAEVSFDPTAAIAMVQAKATTDALNAVADLIELHKYAGETVHAVGWQVYRTLEDVLETATITTGIQDLLTAAHIVSLGAAGTNFTVTDSAD
jgi:hypothetical protein